VTIETALKQMQAVVGETGYTQDPDDLAPWLTDWRGRHSGSAAAMLSPVSAEQASAIVKIAAKHRIALVPQGGNSGMVAGATPDGSGKAVLLSLRRMNRMTRFDPESGLIEAEAGVILQNLHEHVAKQGRRFPLTLGGKGSATVGGLISTNAGGTQVLRHGTMRGLVAGIQAVLPDGSILDSLAPLKKDNRGYDLRHLLIGAEGTLGIVTAATLQTVPALLDRCVLWVGVDSPAMAYALFLELERRASGALEGFELIPDRALQSVLRHIPATRVPLEASSPWYVLVELVQDRPDQIAPATLGEALLVAAMEKGLVRDAALSASEAQAEDFWKLRDSIAEAERAEGPALQHDISVPVADMARFITTESPAIEAHFPGTRVVAFGHLGDGNIHLHVKAPADSRLPDWYENDEKAISDFVYDRVLAYNGSISAEHGIGLAKLETLARTADPARLLAMRAIKTAFDPLGIMNPGKTVPLA
jgi:FAD/FMN-containing dehydrogenase